MKLELMGKRKYRNKPTEVDGITFASKKEAKRYQELKLLERAGEISNLKLQPAFPLRVHGYKIGKYIADFSYMSQSKHKPEGSLVVEDVKSTATKTPVYSIKKKLMLAIHGINISEV